MKKTRWLLLLAAVIGAAAMAIILKPNEADFAGWMEETYEIQCLDEVCDVFQIDTGEEQIVMQTVKGGYSPRIFIAKIHKTYRNYDDPSFQLELKASGFLKNITLETDTMAGVNKREK